MRYVIVLLMLAGCATGSALVTGTQRPATSPESVKILLDPPAQYETIGIVSAEAYDTGSDQTTQDNAVAEIKSQAAKVGANAVILIDIGDRTVASASYNRYSGLFMGSSKRAVLKGKAIWVQ